MRGSVPETAGEALYNQILNLIDEEIWFMATEGLRDNQLGDYEPFFDKVMELIQQKFTLLPKRDTPPFDPESMGYQLFRSGEVEGDVVKTTWLNTRRDIRVEKYLSGPTFRVSMCVSRVGQGLLIVLPSWPSHVIGTLLLRHVDP